MDIEVITDNQNIAKMLKLAFTPEQIHHLLETITANYELGSCPLCGEDEVAVDKQGNDLTESASMIEWGNADYREEHDNDCLVTWLEKQAEVRG
jgi:hypothetical protein